MKKLLNSVITVLSVLLITSCATSRIKTENLEELKFTVQKVSFSSNLIQEDDEYLYKIFSTLPYEELDEYTYNKAGVYLDTSLLTDELFHEYVSEKTDDESKNFFTKIADSIIETQNTWSINSYTENNQIASIVVEQDLETGNIIAKIILEIYENDKVTTRKSIYKELNDWSFSMIEVDLNNASMITFDKNITPVTINSENFTLYKKNHEAERKGYVYIPSDEVLTFICSVYDKGNMLFDEETIAGADFVKAFEVNKKYKVTFKVKRSLVKSERTVKFKITDEGYWRDPEAIPENSEETTLEDDISEDSSEIDIPAESSEAEFDEVTEVDESEQASTLIEE